MALFTAIAASAPMRRFDAMSKAWALLMVAMGLSAAIAAMGAHHVISCERVGSFSSDFSRDFDVARTECRIATIGRSPVVTIYETSPYIEVTWRD